MVDQDGNITGLVNEDGSVASLGGGVAVINQYRATPPASIAKWTSAKTRGGANPAKFLTVGDSNMVGEGSGTGTAGLNGAKFTGMGSKLFEFRSYQQGSLMGDSNVTFAAGSPTVPIYDPRVTFGTGWASDGSLSGILGGRFITIPSASIAGSGRLRLTPTTEFDTFTLYWPQAGAANTAVQVYLDGNLIDTLNQTGATALQSKTYNVALGTHYIEIGATGTGTAYIQNIIYSNSTTSAPLGIVAGACGMLAGTLNTAVWSALGQETTRIAPDFVMYQLTINDLNANTAVNTYRSQVEAFVKIASVTADGVLCVGYPSATNLTSVEGALIDQYVDKLGSIAQDYGWGVIDLRAVFGGSNSLANTRGYRFNDSHPSAAGHIAVANYTNALLASWGI